MVNGAEQPLEVVVDRAWVVGIVVLECLLDGVVGNQPLVFREGDEEKAVEQLLCRGDQCCRGVLRVVVDQLGDQLGTQVFIVAVEAVCDLLVGLQTLLQQLGGLATEQIVRMEQQDETGVCLGFGELGEVKWFVDQGCFADGVETDLQIVGDQHPFRPFDVACIVPCLLYRGFVATGHDGVEVFCFGPFEFKWGDDFVALFVVTEVAECEVDGTTGYAIFTGDGPLFAAAVGLVAEHTSHDVVGEGSVNGDFILFIQTAIFNPCFPLLKNFQVTIRNRLCPKMTFDDVGMKKCHL